MYSYAPFSTLLPTGLPSVDVGSALDEVSKQLDILYRICHQNDTGLLVHGYDAAKSHAWADPKTGAAPIVWSRSLGWYTVGLIDALTIGQHRYPHLTGKGSSSEKLHDHFNSLADAEIKAVQKTAHITGRHALYQVVTSPGKKGNFAESSGTALVAYALAKGVTTGLLKDAELRTQANRTAMAMFKDLVQHFVIDNKNGTLSFNGTSSVASLSPNVVDFEVRLSS